MADMLVNLVLLPDLAPLLAEQAAQGVEIRRGQPGESHKIAAIRQQQCSETER